MTPDTLLGHALARLAVIETTIAKLPIDDTTLRDGLRLAVGDVVEDIAAARSALEK